MQELYKIDTLISLYYPYLKRLYEGTAEMQFNGGNIFRNPLL